jgi:hypothetical protein
MRTTLDISDDILVAAKELAQLEKKSLGQVISELVRRGFSTPAATDPGQNPPPLVTSARSTAQLRVTSAAQARRHREP